MRAAAVLGLTGLALGGASALWSLRADHASPPPAPTAAPAPSAPKQAPAAPAVGTAASAAPAPPPAAATVAPATAASGRRMELALPDGTFVPTLNGAVDAPPLKDYWGPFPWSPIVGVERNDQGLDWYRHQDGSYSTTQMVWRQDFGKNMAMTRVAHPAPGETPPTAPTQQGGGR